MRVFLTTFTLVAFSSLGCTPSEAPPKPAPAETTEAAFNVDGKPTIEIETAGLHCEDCAAGACEILVGMPGVEDVKADPVTKKITVAIDEAEFDSEKALSALRENSMFEDSELAGEGESEENGGSADS